MTIYSVNFTPNNFFDDFFFWRFLLLTIYTFDDLYFWRLVLLTIYTFDDLYQNFGLNRQNFLALILKLIFLKNRKFGFIKKLGIRNCGGVRLDLWLRILFLRRETPAALRDGLRPPPPFHSNFIQKCYPKNKIRNHRSSRTPPQFWILNFLMKPNFPFFTKYQF